MMKISHYCSAHLLTRAFFSPRNWVIMANPHLSRLDIIQNMVDLWAMPEGSPEKSNRFFDAVMVQKMFIHINQKMIPIDTLWTYKKRENYLTIFASQQSMITCFFLVLFNPTFVFFKGHIVGQKSLHHLGDVGCTNTPTNAGRFARQLLAAPQHPGSETFGRGAAVDVIFFVARCYFELACVIFQFVSGFVSPNSFFQVDFKSCLPMIINIP